MEKHLIIARYREDAGWLKDIEFPVYLYDKSYKAHVSSDYITQETIPNIGREAHAYNKYILDHYDNLPDICIFSQCDPFEHVSNFLEIIQKDSLDEMWAENLRSYPDSTVRHTGFLGLGTHSKISLRAEHGTEDFWWLKFKAKELYNKLYTNKLPDSYQTSHGSIIIVEKDNILNNPKHLYEKMMTFHENSNFPAFDWSNETAVALEHLWTFIFQKEEKELSTTPNIEEQKWII